MDFLEKGVDDEEPEKLVEEGESYEPEDLAWLVVDRLDSRMSAEVPDYPRPLDATYYLPDQLKEPNEPDQL